MVQQYIQKNYKDVIEADSRKPDYHFRILDNTELGKKRPVEYEQNLRIQEVPGIPPLSVIVIQYRTSIKEVFARVFGKEIEKINLNVYANAENLERKIVNISCFQKPGFKSDLDPMKVLDAYLQSISHKHEQSG